MSDMHSGTGPDDQAPPLSRRAVLLGYLGLVPQTVSFGLVLTGGPDWRYAALSAAFAYSALIFSFLGGVWWGLASAARRPVPGWLWVVAVIPSLFAMAGAWPWMTGGTWPGPSLVWLGIGITLSIGVDIRLSKLGLVPRGWLRLRVPLSIGLGLLTVATGVAAMGVFQT